MSEGAGSLELQDLRVLASTSNKFCVREAKFFQRNPNLVHIVHALLHLSQFIAASTIKLFHHIYQAINKKLVANDPTIPKLHEEKHLIFFAIPLCMILSLALGIMWLTAKKFSRKETFSFLGCGIGIVFMLLNAVSVMRQPEIYINLEDVSNEELIKHPVFIHNFVICILSIFALAMFLIQFWILYECWRWYRKLRKERELSKSTNSSSECSEMSGLDSDDSSATVPSEEHDKIDVETIPVILYCCCIDCFNWMRHSTEHHKDQHGCVTHAI